MNLNETIGFDASMSEKDYRELRKRITRYVTLTLIANGLPHPDLGEGASDILDAERLLAAYHRRLKLLGDVLCPADARIEQFLQQHFAAMDAGKPLQLPRRSIILDRHGLAREMSLPMNADSYSDEYVSSYRVRNGVLHNPVHDRRTTSGTFHVTEGGLPVPRDKKAVPQRTFAELFRHAVKPPAGVLALPFTANQKNRAETFVSLLLRPLVCPAVPGVMPEKRMEVRFFAPGSLVSNLDFVESIFGNGGDPFAPEHDAGLDIDHWTGHTGCVILAPHLIQLRKCDVGLPPVAEATPRQQEDGMCWQSQDELYNDGQPFKLTCRTLDGVIVTLIADNYYGYCKKEVKTQISYAANLFGNAEEEHAGGAVAFASFNLGDEYSSSTFASAKRTFDEVARAYDGTLMDVKPEGYAVDKRFSNLVYVPENARATVVGQQITWTRDGMEQALPLLPKYIYMTPSGYKFRLDKHPQAPTWRLIGTLPEGVVCHKPCTVSGGGKSEISKSIADYVLHGPVFVAEVSRDFDLVDDILGRDYSDRWRPEGDVHPDYQKRPSRKVLDPSRSLGSTIKLLTPSEDYTDDYNRWLASIPSHIYALVFAIKRMHRSTADDNWRQYFGVDIVNGAAGHELKFGNRKIIGSYLRVGLLTENSWRTYKLRQDFASAQKVQTEDDISASVVVPMKSLDHLGNYVPTAESCKFVQNCEYRLFQRPDDAIHRGLDKQTEADLARHDNFIVNFEPLSRDQIEQICERAVDLSQFTEPMKKLIRRVRKSTDAYAVCSATPRVVEGKPTKNPRYLQTRPDLIDPLNRHVAEMGTRLYRAVPADGPVRMPVHAILVGRRNNPPDYERGFRPLAVYNPIHYQELPELFMDFISALTGKSPSTTGAGSEGALTKGPFNAVLPITDLNNSLVSFLLTGLAGFSTPAGHIGPDLRVDHDISLLIPEIWCRLSPEERDPQNLIAEELLEKLEDYEHKGKHVPASLLGYRINAQFIRRYVGRVFDNPRKVFDESILRPESQDADAFADGVNYIAEAHERVAKNYFADGSIEQACPPLRALLNIMAHGTYEGKKVTDPGIRRMFTVDAMLESDWYQARLKTRQQRECTLWQRHVSYLQEFMARKENRSAVRGLQIETRLASAQNELAKVSAPTYWKSLRGFLGADPMTADVTTSPGKK